MMNTTFDWAVLGAGPAGIAAIGKLIDQGIEPQRIAWIDPEFSVGDFGTRWRKVSSNTRVELFLKFFQECRSFEYSTAPNHFLIHHINPKETCSLELAADVLQWITDHLKNKVISFSEKVQQLKLYERHWELTMSNKKLRAKNVILATGSEPKSLTLPGVEEITLSTALDPEQLQSSCHKDDVIAVFGSSHSAILILKTLLEMC